MADTRLVSPPASRPLDLGLPKETFFSQEWYDRDLEGIFRPYWHFAAHADELQAPGSFVKFRIGRDEVLVVRSDDGGVSAFYNFCTHRGHRLSSEACGQIKGRIVCPYHGWTFSRNDGECKGATRMPDSFDKRPWGLHQAWAEEYHGLIFVCMAEEKPMSVADGAGKLGLGGYQLDGMKLAAHKTTEIAANWKLVRENDDECYHCKLNHPELSEHIDPWSYFTTVFDPENPQPLFTEDDWSIVHHDVQYGGEPACSVLTPRTDDLDPAEAKDVQLFWGPGGHITMSRDYYWLWNIKPLAPNRTQLDQYWLVAPDAQEGRDYTPAGVEQFLATVMEQDERLLEELQNGIEMPRYTPGPLNPYYQAPAAAFYRWYSATLEAHGQPGPGVLVAPNG